MAGEAVYSGTKWLAGQFREEGNDKQGRMEQKIMTGSPFRTEENYRQGSLEQREIT